MAGPKGLYGLTLVSCLVLLTARTEAAGGGSVQLAECCSSPDGLPPRPRIVLLGETGVGKSTLGNRLFGKKPGMCASANSLLNQTHPQLGVGHGTDSHTNETAWVAGKWLGDSNSSCFTVMDTPGVGDTEGRDCEHGVIISRAVKDLSQIDAFVLMVNGHMNRFTKPLQDQLSLYQEMFGVDFWERTVIEISFWRSSNYAKDLRLDGRQMTEGTHTDNLNKQLKDKFSLTRAIPVYFIDPMYPRQRRNAPEEKETFKKETEKLLNFMKSGDPYTCNGTCKIPGFLEGKPVLKSEPIVNAKLGELVRIEFSIWFAGCDGKGDRDYDIYKDGVHIMTVIDEPGENKKKRKPKQMIKNENTPLHMSVFDTCSQLSTNSGSRRDCNIKLSKFKNVRVQFQDITEAGFGAYYINSTNGRSEEVHIVKQTDGFVSEWTEWSIWKKELGAKKRTRICTEPVNGGLPCSAYLTDTCNNDDCTEPSTVGPWSAWKCKEVCSIMTSRPWDIPKKEEKRTHEISTRTCTDATPVHSTLNCYMLGIERTSSFQCGDRTETQVPTCPAMETITTVVCSKSMSGTNDNVQVEFKNIFEETCITGWLDSSSDDFENSNSQNWGSSYLAPGCNSSVFQPIGRLEVRFRTNTEGSNLHHDKLRLCGITAQFGTRGTAGYSKWWWEGEISQATYDGPYNSQSHWGTMNKY